MEPEREDTGWSQLPTLTHTFVNREYRQVDPSLDHKSSSCVYIYVSLPLLVRL